MQERQVHKRVFPAAHFKLYVPHTGFPKYRTVDSAERTRQGALPVRTTGDAATFSTPRMKFVFSPNIDDEIEGEEDHVVVRLWIV